jgi:Leucine-rich repeat (LRR) protein
LSNDILFINEKNPLLISKKLIEVTNKILFKDDWINNIFKWADLNNIDSDILPREKSKLLELKSIRLYDCNLNTIPDEIIKLTNLEYLELTYNNLIRIPENLYELTNLNFLSLAFNNIEKLPDKIINLNLLHNFWINGNSNLILSKEQEVWINKLKNNGCYIY